MRRLLLAAAVVAVLVGAAVYVNQTGPAWYELLQGGIGVIQFLIGLAMLAGYRRSGPWGAF